MSITGFPAKKSQEEKDAMEKAMAEFLKNGGKIKQLAEGEHTEAKDMKYKFRRPAQKKD